MCRYGQTNRRYSTPIWGRMHAVDLIRFNHGERIWSLTCLNSIRLTLVRYDRSSADPYWGIHRHQDGGAVIATAGLTSLHVQWRDDPEVAGGLGRK